MKDARDAIVATALWLVAHHDRCTYSEGAQRMSCTNRPFVLPYVGDCSATVRNIFAWAGAPDIMGLGYNVPEGYTGTMLGTGAHIERAQVIPGDVVVYGPGTGWHTALIVEVMGENLLSVSMGQQGDPSLVWVGAPTCPSRGYGFDSRTPQTFLRFPTKTRHVRYPPKETPGPLPKEIRNAGLTEVWGDSIHVAMRNGYVVYGWDGLWFTPVTSTVTLGKGRWASAKFATERR